MRCASMTELQFKIVVPDMEALKTLASTGSLPRLLSKPRSQLIVIKSVSDPLIVRDPATQAFFEENKTRILIVRTSVCDEDEAKMRRGEFLLQGRSQLAIADFYMHYMDDVVGTSPTIVIEDVSRHRRLGVRGAFPEKHSIRLGRRFSGRPVTVVRGRGGASEPGTVVSETCPTCQNNRQNRPVLCTPMNICEAWVRRA